MQHDRNVTGAILADVFGVEAARGIEVDLQRAALPVTANRVAQHEFQLRAIKCAFPGVQRVIDAGRGAGFLQGALRMVPDRI